MVKRAITQTRLTSAILFSRILLKRRCSSHMYWTELTDMWNTHSNLSIISVFFFPRSIIGFGNYFMANINKCYVLSILWYYIWYNRSHGNVTFFPVYLWGKVAVLNISKCCCNALLVLSAAVMCSHRNLIMTCNT